MISVTSSPDLSQETSCWPSAIRRISSSWGYFAKRRASTVVFFVRHLVPKPLRRLHSPCRNSMVCRSPLIVNRPVCAQAAMPALWVFGNAVVPMSDSASGFSWSLR
jgi:hypothetical protein